MSGGTQHDFGPDRLSALLDVLRAVLPENCAVGPNGIVWRGVICPIKDGIIPIPKKSDSLRAC